MTDNTMPDMDAILNGIRTSYDRTNIQDVDFDSIEVSPAVKVGYLLQNMEPESSKEYAINFDPIETMFLDKLVSQEVLNHRIIMEKQDFFRGIVFLDYMTTIMLDEYDLLDDLLDIAGDLEQRDSQLDPDLGLVTRYAAMYHLSREGRNLIREFDNSASMERYQEKNQNYEPQHTKLRKISPVYEALGQMVCDLPKSDTIREALPTMNYLYDIKAAIFIDAILEQVQDEEVRDDILEQFKQGDYYTTSMRAVGELSKEVTSNTLRSYIQRMTA